jgi:hypothetical protein
MWSFFLLALLAADIAASSRAGAAAQPSVALTTLRRALRVDALVWHLRRQRAPFYLASLSLARYGRRSTKARYTITNLAAPVARTDATVASSAVVRDVSLLGFAVPNAPLPQREPLASPHGPVVVNSIVC